MTTKRTNPNPMTPKTPKRPMGRPRLPEGPRRNIVRVGLRDEELEMLLKVTEFPADFLREAGFSKSQATAIAGKGLKSLLRSESGSETSTDFLSALAAQIRG